MILDERTEFADDTNAYGTAGTRLNIGPVLDLGGDGLDGNSEDLFLVIQVGATPFAGGTTQFFLVSDAQDPPAVNGTATEHFATPAIAAATLVAGHQVCAVQLPRGTYERYLGVQALPAGSNTTAGSINAFLTRTPPAWKAMPDGELTPA